MRLPLPRTRRGRLLLGVLTLVLLGGGFGAWWYDRHYPWYHFHTIVPGALFRAGQPDAGDVAKAAASYGVKTIVSLRAEQGPWTEEERRAAEAAGVRFVEVPLKEGTPPSLEQAEALLRLYDDPAARPLLFHCQYGSIRSAAVEALFRMELLGEDAEQALDGTRTYGHDLETKYPQIPQFIRAYVPRRARGGAPPAAGR